jgi:two-component system alkaline phosphatase synthesis response regulator PhoP
LKQENKTGTQLIILVVEDVHETRDGIEKLLNADGYHVAVARDEHDAIKSALLERPDLILVSLTGLPAEVILIARRIRDSARAGDSLPMIVFCVEGIADGDEVAVGGNVHITRPDNFNQLRGLIARLLREGSSDAVKGTTTVQSGVPIFLSDRSAGTWKAQDEKDQSAE